MSGDLAARMRRLGAAGVGLAQVPAPPAGIPDPAAVAAARAGLAGDGLPLVLAVGRLAPQKGFATLLAAAGHWQGRDPFPVIALAGSGPLDRALHAQADAAGIGVRFLGQRADVPALLAAADVVVVPSLWEGQPLIVQEALRAGRPLVASRVGGIPDLTGEDGAVLVRPGTPQRWPAWRPALDDPALRRDSGPRRGTGRGAAHPGGRCGGRPALYQRIAGLPAVGRPGSRARVSNYEYVFR